MQTISLLVLIVAIAIGFWKNINVGIVSLALGFILTAAMGISVKVLVAGFPTKLFLTLLGTTFLPSCRITRPWNFFREKLSVYLKRGPFSCLS